MKELFVTGVGKVLLCEFMVHFTKPSVWREYIATGGEGIGEWWIWNDLEWTGQGPIWRIIPALRKTAEPHDYQF